MEWAFSAAIFVFLAAATQLSTMNFVEMRVFDIFSTLFPKAPAQPSAVIVAIDEPSFAEIGRSWPWPRSTHAELVRRLRAAGAESIGLDIVFSEPSAADEDESLRGALGPRDVLAVDVEQIDLPQGRQISRIEPAEIIRDSGARLGVTSIALDLDNVLRRIPNFPDGFARALLPDGSALPGGSGDLVQFFGGARTYPTASYYQALDPDQFLPKDFFRGKTVLVGFSLKASPRPGMASVDAFATPFTLRDGTLTAGVEVHATILDNLRNGLQIAQAPLWAALILLALATVALMSLGDPQQPLHFIAIVALCLCALVCSSWLAVRFGRVYAPTLTPALAMVAVAMSRFGVAHVRERRLRAHVSAAFARYVSPDIVEELVRSPTALKLGGERRELTILFCDVRGFTGLAERLQDDPERLMSIINALLDALTEQVLATRGTIDKYMGDCVMAFWNAPLRADDHASRAITAALAMESVVAQVNAKLQSEDPLLEPLSVGIGINTGVCVVGNIGSRWRYDYSVLGDAVNLASRLEGLTKQFGVQIIVGKKTREAAGDHFNMRLLATIAVRGREAATSIYTTEV